MEDNLSNLRQGSSLQGGKYVIEKTLGSGGCVEDVTILSVNDDKGKINGHEYVDLGLSVKWATCNVGASSPTDYGFFYALHERYDSFGNFNSTYEDAARANWGGSWRLPTEDELEELISNCDSEWTTQDSVNGRRFTSKKNGKSIFLPAAGLFCRYVLRNVGVDGDYWGSINKFSYTADTLGFNDSELEVGWSHLDSYLSVRPVSD